MSRTDDLIDLLKATNDILLVNAVQNVRSAYIQVDDLCDLYELLNIMFSDFARKVEISIILKTQMAVMRVKRETYRNRGVNNRYQAILSEWTHGENSKYLPRQGVVLLRHPCVGFEFSAIYLDARGVYEALEEKGLIF